MKGNVLQQFAGRSASTVDAQDHDNEGAEDYGAFGWLRGIRDRAVMLELRKKDGNVTALGYAWLERVDYEPSDGLTLYFTGVKVRVMGRNLDVDVRPNLRLISGLVRHKVPWIQEADEPTAMAGDRRATIVERLDIV